MKKNKTIATALLLTLLAFRAHAQEDSITKKLVPAKTVAEFPANTFLENLAVAQNGDLFVNSHLEGKIYRVTPDGAKTVFAEIEGKPAGIAFGAKNELIVSGWASDGASSVFIVSPAGKVLNTTKIEGALFLNGTIRLKGDRFLMADSYRGLLWEFNAKTKAYKVWLEDDEFKRLDEKNQTPALNGIRLFGNMLYATNTQRQKLLRIKINPDGSAGSKPELFVEKLNGDDFAIDGAGNVYVTTHIYNSVVRVAPDGAKTVIAEATEGVTGDTSLAFGRGKRDQNSLYVVTNGGMSMPPKEGVQPAKVVRLQLNLPETMKIKGKRKTAAPNLPSGSVNNSLSQKAAAVSAPNYQAEFSSAPCSSLPLGPGAEVSNVRRIYLTAEGRHLTRYHFFADDQCTRPLFTFHLTGRLEQGKPHASLPNTNEVAVYFDRVLFTVDSPATLPLAAKCGSGNWEVGVQQDVTKTGCLFLKPRKVSGVDFDLVQIKDGVLTPGFRTANMCSPGGRPTKLQSAGARLVTDEN